MVAEAMNFVARVKRCTRKLDFGWKGTARSPMTIKGDPSGHVSIFRDPERGST